MLVGKCGALAVTVSQYAIPSPNAELWVARWETFGIGEVVKWRFGTLIYKNLVKGDKYGKDRDKEPYLLRFRLSLNGLYVFVMR